MGDSKAAPIKEMPLGLDTTTEEEYASQSKLLQEFTSIPSIDKAWTFKSDDGIGSQAMFSISQPNILANKRRKSILSAHIFKEKNSSVNFRWSPFPVEMTGVSTVVPSPSGSKLFVVRNPENKSPSQFEIWGPSQLEKEFHIPQSVHGSVYTDGWFEGISWNSDETLIAYVAEEPSPSKPTFNDLGYKKGGSTDKDCSSWKGQGDWEEDWGETYAGKRQPALFVININSGEVQAVKGIKTSLSVGQVVWAPSTKDVHQYLVFVGWSSDTRKLGIKYCYNRPCALYAVRAPLYKSEANELELKDSSTEDVPVFNLTQQINSAFFPTFSPGGKYLVFLSARSSVDSGAHSATFSLHRIDWSTDVTLWPSAKIVDVIPVVMSAEDGCFPGLYCSSFLSNPWLSDGCTMIISSFWRSSQVILSVNVLSGEVLCISPADSNFSWNVLTLDGDNIVAVSSSPVNVPQIKYGCIVEKTTKAAAWSWLDVSSSIFKCSEKDVNDVLTAIDHIIEKGLASPSKITVLGGSHGGFLTTHLIGQAPDSFVAAAVRNPACNLALMVGTTDIPDWCYVEACGSKGKDIFSEAPSADYLTLFHSKSPISHLSKVKTPILFLLGAQDIRVPVSNGLQYARTLRKNGGEVKVIMFPNDVHGNERPQSDFESFLNVGVWFRKYCK
ncbi:hypothetical protein RGQ29_023433 [Quercus rubra]|uniref:Acylamino-acid-releasing enzyme n=1 Tax=Quercus rubra TaxID=3512 RepID=A0AAN7F9N9_QUERU|nr:hypothetical protein RGQ29_023433 [Quercus rubra]